MADLELMLVKHLEKSGDEGIDGTISEGSIRT